MISCDNCKYSSKSKALKQDVVKLSCKCYGVKKFAVNKSDGVTKEKDHLVRKFPKGDECKKDREKHRQ